MLVSILIYLLFPVSPLTKKKQTFIKVPVIRPQDLVRKGKGTIHIDCNDMLHVIGTNTQFTTQLCPSDMILMGEDKAQVVEIISDTELMIKHEFKLLDGGEHEYKCMPHVEQASVYQSVHDALNSGGCITIFPEGGSHDRMEMLPLKGKAGQSII